MKNENQFKSLKEAAARGEAILFLEKDGIISFALIEGGELKPINKIKIISGQVRGKARVINSLNAAFSENGEALPESLNLINAFTAFHL